jgi:hypothetical protein
MGYKLKENVLVEDRDQDGNRMKKMWGKSEGRTSV